MSENLTADIIAWREQNGWSWGRIAERARLSRAAVRQRYIRARGQDERAIIAGLRAERDRMALDMIHAAGVVRDLENKMQPVNEYLARLELELAVAHTLIADLESRLGEAQQGLYVMEERQNTA